VKRLSSRAVHGCDTRAGTDQLVGDVCCVAGRGEVQRGVAGVHHVADLGEEILLALQLSRSISHYDLHLGHRRQTNNIQR
jgi:hypothetical protein